MVYYVNQPRFELIITLYSLHDHDWSTSLIWSISLFLSNDMVTKGSLYSKIWEQYDKEWWLTLSKTLVSWGVISWLRGKSMHTSETFHHLTESAATEVLS